MKLKKTKFGRVVLFCGALLLLHMRYYSSDYEVLHVLDDFKIELNVINGVGDLDFDGRKYFLYSPSGGLSNQISCLEYGLHISRALNRTLLVPMMSSHLSLWYNYEKQQRNQLVSFSSLMESKQLSTQFSLIFMNVTNHELEETLLKHYSDRLEVMFHEKRKFLRLKNVRTRLKSDKQIFYLKGASMYHKWASDKIFLDTKRMIIYKSTLWNEALKIRARLGSYNSVHVRRGDYSRKVDAKIDGSQSERITNNLLGNLNFSKSTTLYIATNYEDIFDATFWEPFHRSFDNVIFATDIIEDIDFKNIVGYTLDPVIKMDILGMVEQLICVESVKFFGSWYSNFSERIELMRATKDPK